MGGYRNKGLGDMNVSDVTFEPYTYETGHQLDPIKVTEFFIKIQFGGVWYKSEKHYKIEDALVMRDAIKAQNMQSSNWRD